MFISWNEQQTATAHSKSIIKSRAKAHAARTAHQRALARQTKVRSQSPKSEEDHDQVEQTAPGLLLVWKGNSDPFGSQVIEITPRFSQVVDFLTNVWVPATHARLPAPFPPSVRNFFCTVEMLDPVNSSRDQALTISALLPSASALATLTGSPELEQQRTRLKLLIIKSLRSRLDQSAADPLGETELVVFPSRGGPKSKSASAAPTNLDQLITHSLPSPQPDDTVIALTQSLFISSVNESNSAEAEAHGRMLQWLMRCKTDREGYHAIQPDVLCQAIGYDIVRSQLSGTPSVFDTKTWVPACQAAYKLAILDTFQTFRRQVLDKLDPCLRGTPLQSIFLGTHQCFRLWSKVGEPKATLQTDQIWAYVTLTNAALQLQATNYSLVVESIIRQPNFATGTAASVQAYWRIQACLAFGVLLWQLTNITDLNIGGRSYWPRGIIIAGAMRRHIQDYLDGFASVEGWVNVHHKNVLLFAYWMGASWRRKATRREASVEDCFFHHGLRTMALQYHLVCSEDVRAIVELFLPSIHMRPRDWKWLDTFLLQDQTKPSRLEHQFRTKQSQI